MCETPAVCPPIVETQCRDKVLVLDGLNGGTELDPRFCRSMEALCSKQGFGNSKSQLAWTMECPGIDNPADLVSRGMFAEDLIQSDLWLSGPSFLLESDHMVMQTSQVMSCAAGPTSDVLAVVLADAVPLEPTACPVADDSQEPLLSTCAAKPSVANTLRSKRNFSTVLFDTERWGSFKRAQRVVAWCLRFVHNVKSAVTDESRLTGDLTYHKLIEAKTSLFKDDQRRYFSEELAVLSRDEPVPASSSIASLSPYLGTDGLIRVRGRLQFSDLSFNEKHPIILPKSHLSWLLVQFQHCLMKHAGVWPGRPEIFFGRSPWFGDQNRPHSIAWERGCL